MGSYTKGHRQQLEEIHKRIIDGHRRGVCDKDGNPIPPRTYGQGQLRSGINPWGHQKLNVWPRDAQGNLIE